VVYKKSVILFSLSPQLKSSEHFLITSIKTRVRKIQAL